MLISNRNRSGKRQHFKAFLGLLASAMLILPAVQVEAAPRLHIPAYRSGISQTIDFSIPGEGPFQPDFFKRQGLIFTEGDFVGFCQGDEALVGPIAGTFRPPVYSLSLNVAPALQGTAEYTLTAYSASGKVVGSTSVIVTQDTGDPENGPDGYFRMELPVLAQRAKTFTLENRFIRSSFPKIKHIEFCVSSITYTTRPGP